MEGVVLRAKRNIDLARNGFVSYGYTSSGLKSHERRLVMHSEERLRAYVGPNAEYHIKRFNRYNNGGVEEFRLTWNWSACLLGVFYVLYRKMYLFAGIGLILCFIPGVVILWNLLVAPVVTNYLYYKHVNARINKYAAAIQDENSLLEALRSAGGVNTSVAVVLAVLVAVLVVIVLVIMGLVASAS